MQEPEEHETHDIYLAAYFLVAGCKIVRERRVGARKYFVFTNVGGSMSDLRTNFYSGNSMVKANDYAQRIKDMKNLVMTS